MKSFLILLFFILMMTYTQARSLVNTNPPSWWYQSREYPLSPEPYIPLSWTAASSQAKKSKPIDYLKIYHGNKPFFEWDSQPKRD